MKPLLKTVALWGGFSVGVGSFSARLFMHLGLPLPVMLILLGIVIGIIVYFCDEAEKKKAAELEAAAAEEEAALQKACAGMNRVAELAEELKRNLAQQH